MDRDPKGSPREAPADVTSGSAATDLTERSPLPKMFGPAVTRRGGVRQLEPDLVGFDYGFVWQFLLLEPQRATLIDTGLLRAGRRIRKWFDEQGHPPQYLSDIVLTHGHLDHAGCAESLRRWSGATVHLHPADGSIVRGEFPYAGKSRFAGTLERLGRPLLRYRVPEIGAELADGQTLDRWGGLQVVHLPGHTPGHVGLYSPSRKLLFVGDAIIAPRGKASFPLDLFNCDGARNRRSVVRAAGLDLETVYPNHGVGGAYLVESLRRYAAGHGGTTPDGRA